VVLVHVASHWVLIRCTSHSSPVWLYLVKEKLVAIEVAPRKKTVLFSELCYVRDLYLKNVYFAIMIPLGKDLE